MYVVQPYRLTAAECDALLALPLDVAPGPGGSRISDASICAALLPDWAHGRLQVVALYPSSQLVAHVDPPIDGVRWHVPLAVNPGCWVFHGGAWQQLERGQCYAMDPTEIHGAVNWGETLRLHLVSDGHV